MSRTGRRVGLASAIWGVSILLSRVIGIVRESVIGRTLGGGPEADVYWTAFVIPDWMNYLLAGGAVSLMFIPIFGGYLARGEEKKGWEAFSVIANFLTVMLLVTVSGLWLLVPRLVGFAGPGYDSDQLALLSRLTRIVLPGQIFHVIGALLSASLMARDKHLLPALAPLLYSGSIVVCGVLLGGRLGAEGFAWGVLVGSALGPFGMPLIGCLRHGLGWRPLFSLRHPDFRRYLWLSLPVMLGASVVFFDDWIIKRIASGMESGSVSELQYARTLMKVPMGVFGLAAASAAFPTLSRLVATGKNEEAWGTLMGSVRGVLVLAAAAQTGLTVAGSEVATVILGTSRFAPQQLLNIGLYTGLLCLGLWAWSAQGLLARGFYAMEKTWLPTVVGTVITAACYPLYLVLGARLGPTGLAIASSLAISAYTTALALLLRRILGRAIPRGEGPPDLWHALLRVVPSIGIGVAAGLGLGQLLERAPLPGGTLGTLLRGALAGGPAALLTLALASIFGIQEVRPLVVRIRKKLLRR